MGASAPTLPVMCHTWSSVTCDKSHIRPRPPGAANERNTLLITRIVQIIFCTGVTWGIIMAVRVLIEDARRVRVEPIKIDYDGSLWRRSSK